MRTILLLLGALTACAMAHTQDFGKADLSISSILIEPSGVKSPASIKATSVTGQDQIAAPGKKIIIPGHQQEEPKTLNCTITVQNGNQDPAYDTKLVVVLPASVQADALASHGEVHKVSNATTLAGYVSFDLGTLMPGQMVTVKVWYRKVNLPADPAPYRNYINVFVFSNSEDPNPTNNSKVGQFDF